MDEPVGRVLGTVDATPLQFWVAVTPGAYLQLDDVVVTHREVPGREPVAIAGVVTQVRARHEGAQFESDVFAIADGTLPAQVQEAAEITTTRVEPEVYVPPAPGALVHRAAGDERAAALYFDRMEKRIPIGTGRDGEPLFLNAEFLDGTRGAHVSISGISGVATKTSFATFLLYCVFRSGVLGGEAANTKALIFNVKGEDLLFLDHPNNRLDADDHVGVREARACRPAPFPDVAVYAPPRAGDTSGTPDVSSRLSGVDSFYWTLAEFCADRLLPYVFADADDERQQYTMVVHAVTAHLAKVAVPADGGVAIDGTRLGSYADLVDFIVAELNDEDSAVDVGRQRGRAGHGQRVRAPADRLEEGPVPADPRRPAGAPRARHQHRRERPGHRRRPAQPAGPGAAVRGRRHAAHRVRAQGEGRHREAAAVRGARRAQQVRAARGHLADQGGAARHRRARPLAGRRADRRAADRERGRAAHRRQLGDPGGRPARRGRGVPPGVRLPAAGAARAGADRQARHHVRQPAGDPGAAGASSSRSRPGRPGRPRRVRRRARRCGR